MKLGLELRSSRHLECELRCPAPVGLYNPCGYATDQRPCAVCAGESNAELEALQTHISKVSIAWWVATQQMYVEEH